MEKTGNMYNDICKAVKDLMEEYEAHERPTPKKYAHPSPDYSQRDRCTFSEVVSELTKYGGLVATRKGWNGKGMFIYFTPGHVVDRKDWTGPEMAVTGERVVILGHFDMKTAGGPICIGWLASQTDMVADDWSIINPQKVKECR